MTESSERAEYVCELHGVVGARRHCPLCEVAFERRERESA